MYVCVYACGCMCERERGRGEAKRMKMIELKKNMNRKTCLPTRAREKYM